MNLQEAQEGITKLENKLVELIKVTPVEPPDRGGFDNWIANHWSKKQFTKEELILLAMVVTNEEVVDGWLATLIRASKDPKDPFWDPE